MEFDGIQIIGTFAAVIVALYIMTIMVGVFATNGAEGGTIVNENWNKTLEGIDIQGSSAFNIASILPMIVIVTGLLSLVIGAFLFKG